MKKLSVLFALLFAVSAAFTESPELKNMMPNSWEKLTRLSESEEKEFLNKQPVKEDMESTETESWAISKFLVKEKRVYKETANHVDFYRVLACNYNMDDFFNAAYKDTIISEEDYEKYIHQSIRQTIYVKQESRALYKLKSLESKVYGIAEGNMETEGCEYFIFHDFMIKKLNKDDIGFFMTEASIGYQAKRKNQDVVIEYCSLKNQQCGSNSTKFLRVNNNENFSKAFKDNDRRVRISASDYLFDSKCPLKYSIQNAFDGNPATSYVENTEDDLIQITFPGYEKEYNGEFKIAIINGYAKNETLYTNNNRVKNISVVSYKVNDNKTELIKREPIVISLDDNCLKNQTKKIKFLGLGQFYFNTSEIFKGIKYNDTCIAEINYCDGKGWQFGEIDE